MIDFVNTVSVRLVPWSGQWSCRKRACFAINTKPYLILRCLEMPWRFDTLHAWMKEINANQTRSIPPPQTNSGQTPPSNISKQVSTLETQLVKHEPSPLIGEDWSRNSGPDMMQLWQIRYHPSTEHQMSEQTHHCIIMVRLPCFWGGIYKDQDKEVTKSSNCHSAQCSGVAFQWSWSKVKDRALR